MEFIHSAPVSWPLGVRSSSNFTRSKTEYRKPRAKTAPLIRNKTERKPTKKGQPVYDLSPRTHGALEKKNINVVQPEVPILRDVLEILTCDSSVMKQNQTHSADRVRLMQKTVLKRGVPLTAAEVALRNSRRFRHPERLEANLPVSTVRLVASARGSKVEPWINETQANSPGLDFTPGNGSNVNEGSYTKNNCNVQKVDIQRENKVNFVDSVPEETKSEPVINFWVDSPRNTSQSARENVPTISSGTAGAPPPPPSTPEHQRRQIPTSPVEKALKHNSATYSYRRHQRKSRVQSALETKRIIYQTNVETLTLFPVANNKAYNKNIQEYNNHMNIISRNTIEQLYSDKDRKKSQRDLVLTSRPMTASSIYKSQGNKNLAFSKDKKYVTVTTVRPFSKPSVSSVKMTHPVDYIPDFEIKNGKNFEQRHDDKVNDTSNEIELITEKKSISKETKQQANLAGLDTPGRGYVEKWNTKNRGSMENANNTKYSLINGVKTLEKEDVNKSLHIAPIVIPCASVDTDDKVDDIFNTGGAVGMR